MPSYAEVDPLNQLRDTTLSFFTPVEGSVTAVEDNIVFSDLGETSGVKKGMRLNILRKGKPFLHPITKEPIGQIETPVGTAEVIETTPDGSKLAIIKGNAQPGDILRVSSAQVKTLFYQSEDVDWNISEEYYSRLKNTGRFALIDTAPNKAKDSEIINEAKKHNAKIAIILSADYTGVETTLRQRILWVEDSKLLSDEEVTLSDDFIREIKLGEEIFIQKTDTPPLSFDLPFRTELIAMGDLNGDGTEELIMNTGKDIVFYSIGASLKPALDGLEIKIPADEHLWLDACDLDNDKKDELVITAMKNNEIVSYIYKYKNRAFSQIWEGDFFVRVIDGRLYGQDKSTAGGYTGQIFPVQWHGQNTQHQSTLKPPAGINLYDFNIIHTPEDTLFIAYDDSGYLNLYDSRGIRLWQSSEDYGGAIKKFKKASPTVMINRGEWSVKDRIILRGKTALVIKRIPLAKMAKGIGYKSSQIMQLLWTGDLVKETPLIDYIPGKAIDLAVSGKRLLVLARPLFGIQSSKILKGKNPLTTKLYIYPLRGN